MYSSVNNIAHIAVQLQHNDRFSNCVLLYWLYKLYCSGRLEEVHKGNDCSYTICTEMVLQWHYLLCSTAIDCCSAFRHKLLDTERSVTSNTVRMGEPNIGHSSTAPCRNICKTGVWTHTEWNVRSWLQKALYKLKYSNPNKYFITKRKYFTTTKF